MSQGSAPTPAERVWTVPCFVRADSGELLRDPGQVREAMLELAGILMRIGGMVQMVTRREEISPGAIETTEVIVRWRSYAPVTPLPADAEEALEAAGAQEAEEVEEQPVAEQEPALA